MIPPKILLSHVAMRTDRVNAAKQELEDSTKSRDTALRAAYAGGVTIAELSRASGLSRTMLYRILDPK